MVRIGSEWLGLDLNQGGKTHSEPFEWLGLAGIGWDWLGLAGIDWD